MCIMAENKAREGDEWRYGVQDEEMLVEESRREYGDLAIVCFNARYPMIIHLA